MRLACNPDVGDNVSNEEESQMALTPKQENFCLAYLETGNASEAYRRAYEADGMSAVTVNKRASELLDNGAIAGRLEELRAPIIAKAQLTVEDLLAELEQTRQIALSAETPQTGPAVSATMGKAKLLGLDKQVIDHISSDKSMTPPQVDAKLVGALVDKLID